MGEAASPASLKKEGLAAYNRSDYDNAARLFEAARQGYAAAENLLDAAEMANNICLAQLHAGQPQAALEAVSGTAEVFASAGDRTRQGMALGNLGAVLEAQERNDEAIAAYQQSAEILAQTGDDQLRASVMQSLSALLYRLNRPMEALASMQNGLEGVRKPSIQQRFLKNLLNIPYKQITRKQE